MQKPYFGHHAIEVLNLIGLKSDRYIAKTYGISTTTVANIRKRYGIARYRDGSSHGALKEAVLKSLQRDELTFGEIQSFVRDNYGGVSDRQIRRVLALLSSAEEIVVSGENRGRTYKLGAMDERNLPEDDVCLCEHDGYDHVDGVRGCELCDCKEFTT